RADNHNYARRTDYVLSHRPRGRLARLRPARPNAAAEAKAGTNYATVVPITNSRLQLPLQQSAYSFLRAGFKRCSLQAVNERSRIGRQHALRLGHYPYSRADVLSLSPTMWSGAFCC